jgi:hypothetical protein
MPSRPPIRAALNPREGHPIQLLSGNAPLEYLTIDEARRLRDELGTAILQWEMARRDPANNLGGCPDGK